MARERSLEWLQALYATPPQIAGVRLRPYALIHNYTLRSLGSPYAVGGPALPSQLFFALAVCARTYAELQRDLFGPAADPPRLAGSIRWRRDWRFPVADVSFREYLGDFTQPPRHWKSTRSESRPVAAPWEWHLARTLCRDWGQDWAAAWDWPVGRARCCYDVSAEAGGDTSLRSEAEDRAIEEAHRGDGKA